MSGPYAFPRRLPDCPVHPDEVLRVIDDHAGMTLRDYFAAKALQAMVSSGIGKVENPFPVAELTGAAYEFADAMLKARSA